MDMHEAIEELLEMEFYIFSMPVRIRRTRTDKRVVTSPCGIIK
jgi:hypothetical protein